MKQFARLLFVRPGLEFLAIEQRVGNTTMWNLPGGKISGGERPKQAVLREVIEEIDLKIGPQQVRKLIRRQITFDNEKWMGHFFIAFGPSFSLCIREPEKITQIRWITLEEAKSLRAYHAAFSEIFAVARDKLGIDLDWGSGLQCLRRRKSSPPSGEENWAMLPL